MYSPPEASSYQSDVSGRPPTNKRRPGGILQPGAPALTTSSEQRLDLKALYPVSKAAEQSDDRLQGRTSGQAEMEVGWVRGQGVQIPGFAEQGSRS